jgi:hypothetical protein
MKLILSWILFFPCVLWAQRGDVKGNGGNFLVCPAVNGSVSYELLDLYEASNEQGFSLRNPEDKNLQNKNWEALVQSLLDELKKVSPLRAQNYQDIFADLKSRAQYLVGDFSSSGDVGPVSIPKGCDLVQAATQFSDPVTEEKKFYINSDVWNLISDYQRAALIVHEIILTEAVESGQSDSKRARFLNGYLWSTDFLQTSTMKLRDFIQQKLLFRYVDYGTYWLELFDENQKPRDNHFYANGAPWEIYTRSGVHQCLRDVCWVTGKNSVTEQAEMNFDDQGHLLALSIQSGEFIHQGKKQIIQNILRFYSDGSVRQVEFANPYVWSRMGQNINLNGVTLFYPSGAIQAAELKERIQIPVGGVNTVSVTVGGSSYLPENNLTFFENGILAHGAILDSEFLLMKKGRAKVEAGWHYFDKLGYLEN